MTSVTDLVSNRYPIAYSVVILPMSIVRWIMFGSLRSSSIPSAATLAVVTLFHLSGAVNVLLLVFARPGLLLLRPRLHPREPVISVVHSNSHLTFDIELASISAERK